MSLNPYEHINPKYSAVLSKARREMMRFEAAMIGDDLRDHAENFCITIHSFRDLFWVMNRNAICNAYGFHGLFAKFSYLHWIRRHPLLPAVKVCSEVIIGKRNLFSLDEWKSPEATMIGSRRSESLKAQLTFEQAALELRLFSSMENELLTDLRR